MTDKELRTLDEILTNLEIWSTWNKTFANEMIMLGAKIRNLLADRKTEPTHEMRTETHECVKDTHDKTEPQEGKWIAKTENNHSHWVCSECGAWALLEYNEQQCLSNFCPDCGARMKGADDDQILLR